MHRLSAQSTVHKGRGWQENRLLLAGKEGSDPASDRPNALPSYLSKVITEALSNHLDHTKAKSSRSIPALRFYYHISAKACEPTPVALPV